LIDNKTNIAFTTNKTIDEFVPFITDIIVFPTKSGDIHPNTSRLVITAIAKIISEYITKAIFSNIFILFFSFSVLLYCFVF
jgi:hypothetical protein